jgi:CMP-N,N'-diacetyllegionaminic acid synthase
MQTRAIIPARIGSKGIPKKNLAVIDGLSLIERAIETAKESASFSEIIVSSDSDEILDTALALGATPYQRPPEISQDTSKANEVVTHVLGSLSPKVLNDDVFFYLQPSSPFTRAATIQDILRKILQERHPIFSARKSDPAEKLLRLDDSMIAHPLLNDGKPTGNRQSFMPAYIATGSCYAFTVEHFNAWKDVPVLGATAHLVRWPEDFDIDSQEDLLTAQIIAGIRGHLHDH